MDTRTRVIIADDHAIFREGLRGILAKAEDFEVVAMVNDGVAALEAVQEYRPDILLLDVDMPRASGFQVLEALLRQPPPRPRAFIVSAFFSEEAVLNARAAGAAGYFLKDEPPDALMLALRNWRVDEFAAPSFPPAALRAAEERRAPRAELTVLTPREKEISALLVQGFTTRDIAEKFGTAPDTVRAQNARLEQKLNVTGRRELLHYLMKNRWHLGF